MALMPSVSRTCSMASLSRSAMCLEPRQARRVPGNNRFASPVQDSRCPGVAPGGPHGARGGPALLEEDPLGVEEARRGGVDRHLVVRPQAGGVVVDDEHE